MPGDLIGGLVELGPADRHRPSERALPPGAPSGTAVLLDALRLFPEHARDLAQTVANAGLP